MSQQSGPMRYFGPPVSVNSGKRTTQKDDPISEPRIIYRQSSFEYAVLTEDTGLMKPRTIP